MRELYLASVTIHVLAAVFWIGGMFFFALVGAPALRRLESTRLRADLFRQLGERFRRAAWIAIAILLVTGTTNLWLLGLLRIDILADPAFWLSPYGRSLGWKLVAVTAMLVVSALHDFVLGPAAARHTPGSPEALRARHRAALLARGKHRIGRNRSDHRRSSCPRRMTTTVQAGRERRTPSSRRHGPASEVASCWGAPKRTS